MTIDEEISPGLEDDIFAAGDFFVPFFGQVVLALQNSREMAQEAEEALRAVREEIEGTGGRTSPASLTALQVGSERLVEIQEALAESEACYAPFERVLRANKGRGEDDEPEDLLPGEESGIEVILNAHSEIVWRREQIIERIVEVIKTPDPVEPRAAPIHLPVVTDAAACSQQAAAELDVAISSMDDGEIVVLAISPGGGKTEEKIKQAIALQMNTKRVIYSCQTKEMLREELLDRIEKRAKTTAMFKAKCHIITGRDEDNCPNFANVEAVQAQGYAPGNAVCPHCDYSPARAHLYGEPPCDYYGTRMAANNDSMAVRRGMARNYPLILMPHALVVPSFESGGRYSQFLACDFLFIDEDPTSTIETETFVTEAHAGFEDDPLVPAQKPTGDLAKILSKAIEIAEGERSTAKGIGYRIAENVPTPNHSSHGSSYAGREFHRVLDEAYGSVSRTTLLSNALMPILRDTSQSSCFTVAKGDLCGVKTAADLNRIVPPMGLKHLAEAVCNEKELYDRVKFSIVRSIDVPRKGLDPHDPRTMEIASGELAAQDFCYVCRLEYIIKDSCWRFVVKRKSRLNTAAKTIIGDAYAQRGYYDDLLQRKVHRFIQKVAYFPKGNRITRIPINGSQGYLLGDGGIQETKEWATKLIEMKRQEGGGRKILLYGSKAIGAKLEDWMEETRRRYNPEELVFEHFYGGRGKDQYKDFDLYIQVSSPVMNLDAMLHTANARQFWESIGNPTGSGYERIRLPDGGRGVPSERFGRLDRVDRKGVLHKGTHEKLFTEHQRQNVAEQTQGFYRTRPSWRTSNPVSGFILGREVEFSADLHFSTQPLSEVMRGNPELFGTLDTKDLSDGLISSTDMYQAMLAVIAWFGVWSPIFSHALLPLALNDLEARRCTCGTVHGGPDGTPGRALGAPGTTPGTEPDKEGFSARAGQENSNVACPSLYCSLSKLHCYFLVSRVWAPSVGYSHSTNNILGPGWHNVTDRDLMDPALLKRVKDGCNPPSARAAHARLAQQLNIACVTVKRHPSWTGRGCPRDRIFFDLNVLGNRPEAAERLYRQIIANYGHDVGDRSSVPDPGELPGSLADLPF